MSAHAGVTRKETYVAAARRAGHDVRRYRAAAGAHEMEQYVVMRAAPLTARGYVVFHLLAPFGWVCDECGQRVTPGKFQHHAKRCAG